MDPKTAKKANAPARYLLTGGGTAGHVYPALSIAEAILDHEPGAEFMYLGARNGAEERIVPAWGFPLLALPIRGLPPSKSPFKLLRFLALLFLSTGRAVLALRRFKPHAIIGTGGYASAPVFVAAVALRFLGLWKGVLSLHEQNIVPGRFNRWMARWADFVGTSFPDDGKCFPRQKTFWTGYPIRKAVIEASGGNPEAGRAGRERLGIPLTEKVMLVFGGSSGARTINEALLACLPELLERQDIHIFHATGYPQGSYDPEEDWRRAQWAPQLAEAIALRYHRVPFLDPIGFYYGIADLVVGRSGAGSVWEMVAADVFGLLIPKAGLPGDHQVRNARFLERLGRARILYESVKRAGPGEDRTAFIDPAAFVQDVLSLLYNTEHVPEGVEKPITNKLSHCSNRFYCILNLMVENKDISGIAPSQANPELSPPWENRGSDRPLEWIPPAELAGVLERLRQKGEVLAGPDRRYVRSQTERLIHSSRWQERNLGVKLAGLLQEPEMLPHVLHLITDRTPAPPWQRMLGGDYREVGFIRRNALQALWRIRVYDPRVKQALLQAMSDPYFEARSWAARAVLHLSSLVGNDKELECGLRRNLGDPWFEVIVFALESLGEISTDPGVLADVLPLLEHHNWKVQEKAVRCITRLLERGVVRLDVETEARMRRIPMKGLDFSPRFPLQKTWESFLKVRSMEDQLPPDPD